MTLNPQYESLLQALETEVEAAGVGFDFRGRIRSSEAELAGQYIPAQPDPPYADIPPRIEVFREKSQVAEDFRRDAFTLAHEWGHRCSEQAGHHTAD